MDLPATDWRAAVGEVIGDHDAFAADLATRLEEPYEDIRATVRLWLLLHGVKAGIPEVEAATERLRRRAWTPERSRPDLLEATTLDELYEVTLRGLQDRPFDPDLVVEAQQTAGAIAARTGPRLVLFLIRLAYGRRVIWERCAAEVDAGRLDPAVLRELGQWLLVWTEMTSLAVTEGFRAAEREILARDADARRAALDELLGVVTADPVGLARTRRVAARFGLDPDRSYRLAVVAPGAESDPTPHTPGLDPDDLEILASRLGHLLGATSMATEGAGAGIRLPIALVMRGRIVVLAADDGAMLRRLPDAIARVLDAMWSSGGSTRSGPPSWVAVGSAPVDGVGPLAGVLLDLLDASRTAALIGRQGWIDDPEALAVERLLLASRELGVSAVDRELGPLLADERMGEELVETLQVYFDSGENMRETARRLHLANRTVAYRLERIETLLGGPLDGELRRRLSVALLVRRLAGTR